MEKISIILILIFATFCFAENLSLSVSLSSFKPVNEETISTYDSLVYVEVFYEFNRNKLDFKLVKESWQAEVAVHFEMHDRNGEEIDRIDYESEIFVQDEEEAAQDYYVFEKFPLLIPPGEYSLGLKVCQGDNCDGFSEKYNIEGYSDSLLEISDITLLSDIIMDSSESKFAKYGRKLLPNCSNTIGLDRFNLYFYAEIYNLEFTKGQTDNVFMIQYLIMDKEGDIVKIFPQTKVKKPGKTSIIIDGIESSSFDEGNYALGIKVYDPSNQQQGTKYKSFTIKHTRDITESEDFKEQITEFGNMLNFVGTRKEQNLYGSLSDVGKFEFMKKFWETKDTIPETPENEYRDTFILRWNYVISAFSDSKNANLEGWETDGGRTYLKYGPPDNIERHTITIYGNEWEKWEYFNLQGGSYFIFADLLGLGQMKILHSTVDGERNNPNWQYEITNDPLGIMQELDEQFTQ
ncbi:GWxTD domain-containing protein [bacterium]|nr:GWxTD domain-containing protein [bacterium]